MQALTQGTTPRGCDTQHQGLGVRDGLQNAVIAIANAQPDVRFGSLADMAMWQYR
jgi:hypothetical protein